MKFNKKRNIILLYEILVRLITSASMNEEYDKQKRIVSVLKESFARGTQLRKALKIYKSILNSTYENQEEFSKVLTESKRQFDKLNEALLFSEQSNLIKRMNLELGKDVYNTFVPSYRVLSTLNQVLIGGDEPKKQIILEIKLNEMLLDGSHQYELEDSSNLMYKVFVDKFNEKYGSTLLKEQKELLSYYIISFSDSAGFKTYVNEQVELLRKKINEKKEVEPNEQIRNGLTEVVAELDKLRENQISEDVVQKLYDVQNLVFHLGDSE